MPDLVSLIALAFILLVSLKVVDYAHRVIVFWVSLGLRLAFWGLVALVVYYAYTLGLAECLRDFGWVAGVIDGFAEAFRDYVHKGGSTA